jgi:hypothetical protein
LSTFEVQSKLKAATSTADDVPLDVVQRLPGRASLQKTSIYVQTGKQQLIWDVK